MFKCETMSYVKSTGENVCAIILPTKANFSKAVELCGAIGARLPEIFTGFDQRSIERRKVTYEKTGFYYSMNIELEDCIECAIF